MSKSDNPLSPEVAAKYFAPVKLDVQTVTRSRKTKPKNTDNSVLLARAEAQGIDLCAISDKNLLRNFIGLLRSRQYGGLSYNDRGALRRNGLAHYDRGRNGDFALTERGEQLLAQVLEEEAGLD